MAEHDRTRVILLADPAREGVSEIIADLRKKIAPFAEIVREYGIDDGPLPADIEGDLAIAIGGDGTLISQARRLVETGLPLVGVNIGRLGFLAEFDVDDLVEQADAIFRPDPPVREHMMLHARVLNEKGDVILEDIAVNDCVISNGEPFKMIELSIDIDGVEGPVLTGDGVIISTPIGSTAYNVSAGGPIVHRGVDAMIITPLAAHSLAFRPIVVHSRNELQIRLNRTIPGTVLVNDGNVSAKLHAGQVVVIRRHEVKARIIDNPATSYWHILMEKMRWAAPPTYRDRGG